MADGLHSDRLPRSLLVLRILGIGALLAFPVAIALVSRLRYPDSAFVLFTLFGYVVTC